MVTQLRKIVFILLIIWSNVLFASDVKISISQDPVLLNESFTITFKVDGKITQMPDFSPIENDFQIISSLQQSDMSIVNGNMEQSVVFVLELLPRKSGTIRLPSIQFGDELSSARLLTVIDGSTANARSSKQYASAPPSKEAQANHEPIILEASLSKSKVYLSEQSIITLKLFYSIPILSGTLSDPIFKDGEAFVQKLGEDKHYSTTLKGRHFEVIERHYALYPQKSGKLKIDPVVFEGQVSHQLQSFFGNIPGQGATKRIRTKPLEIEVSKPLFEPWLPASKLELTESWSDNVAENNGEPLTRTIQIRAVGQPVSGIPNLKIKYPEGIRAYPDRANKNDLMTFQGITGVKEEKIVLMPSKNGTVTLPEVQIKWFDTTDRKIKIASLPEKIIQVSKSASQSINVNDGTDENELKKQESSEDSNEVSSVSSQNRVASASLLSNSIQLAKPYLGYLGWIFSIFIAILAIFYTKYSGRRGSTRMNAPQVSSSSEELLTAERGLSLIEFDLKKACSNNDPKLAERFLLDYCKHKFQNQSLTTLISLVPYFDAEMKKEITHLNQARYSNLNQSWEGGDLWSALKRQQFSKKILNQTHHHLKPLYPKSNES